MKTLGQKCNATTCCGNPSNCTHPSKGHLRRMAEIDTPRDKPNEREEHIATLEERLADEKRWAGKGYSGVEQRIAAYEAAITALRASGEPVACVYSDTPTMHDAERERNALVRQAALSDEDGESESNDYRREHDYHDHER